MSNDDGAVGFVCYSCDNPKGIHEQAAARGLVASRQGARLARAALVAEGLQVWADAVPVEGTEATYYLASRGLSPPYPSTVRAECGGGLYHDKLIAWALVCLVEHVHRGILGVHTIRLCQGGRCKAAQQDRGRKSLYRRYGLLDGGGVWLGTPGGELVVGEGLETTLSAMVLLDRSWGVAALGAAGMTRLDLPDSAECVCIAADNDADGNGQEQAAAAQARWVREGHTVRVATPDQPDIDFNDILVRRNVYG